MGEGGVSGRSPPLITLITEDDNGIFFNITLFLRPNGADCPLYVNQKNKQPRIDEKTPDETLQESRCKKAK